MRWRRIVSLVAALILVIAAALTILFFHFRDRVGDLMLAQIRARSGLDLTAQRSRLSFSTHLAILLEEPRLLVDGRERLRAQSLVLLFSYRALIHQTGVPLYRIAANRPQIYLASGDQRESAIMLPLPNVETVAKLDNALSELSKITRKFRISDGAIYSGGTQPIADQISLYAWRKTDTKSPWRLRFKGHWNESNTNGLFAGRLRILSKKRSASEKVANGDVEFWNATFAGIEVGADCSGSAHLSGKLGATLSGNGTLTADVELKLHELSLALSGTQTPITAAGYEVHFRTAVGSDRIEASHVRISRQNVDVASGGGFVQEPFSDDPAVVFHLGGIAFDVAAAKPLLQSLISAPERLREINIVGGRVILEVLALASPVKRSELTGNMLWSKLLASFRVLRGRIKLPARLGFPEISGLNGQVHLANNVVTITQANARLDESEITHFNCRMDFAHSMQRPAYSAMVRGHFDLGELYGPLTHYVGATGEVVRRNIGSLAGFVDLKTRANGELELAAPAVPAHYSVVAIPRQVEVEIKAIGKKAEITGGEIDIQERVLKLDRLIVALERGVVKLSGDFGFDDLARHQAHGLEVSFNQVPAEDWLVLAPDLKGLILKGPVNGGVIVNSNTARAGGVAITGKLTIGPGEVGFAFLRSPIKARSANLILNGRGAELSMSRVFYENELVDLDLKVPNFRKLDVRIEVTADNLDLEALKFIRLPWSPKTPNYFGEMRVAGRLKARRAKLTNLRMENLDVDFDHDKVAWIISNLTARAMGGDAHMVISGRQADEWVRVKGHAANLDLAELIQLAAPGSPPALRGRLFADFNILANTDVDFFKTMGGNCSIIVRDGALQRFTMLSRMLGMIDLKSWLTANVPDPRQVGVPFAALTADFKGAQGNFHTDDLLLDGPVMNISAAGDFDLGKTTVDLHVAMFPFKTVHWLIGKIPVIGTDIANSTGHIVGAYFHVTGSMSDPSVTPEPITSVAEIIKRTLGLPINLIAPNSIR